MSERHYRELAEGSGLPVDVIAERGYRTVTDPAELRALGFADEQCRPGYVLPQHGTDGSNGICVLKPDRPRFDIKYEWPKGQGLRLDVPKRCQADLLDPTVDLWLTESSGKKQDKLAAMGYCALGFAGIWGWQKGGDLLPDWDPILPTLDGRRVFVVFDTDPAANAKARQAVGLAERRLANKLRALGAWVSLVHLPPGPNDTKMAVDDFLVAHDVAELDALAESAAAQAIPPEGDVAKLRAQLRELQQLVSAQASVRRNPNLSPRDKVVSEAILYQNASSSGPPHGLRKRVAGDTGLSEQTVSTAFRVLSSPGGPFQYVRRNIETETAPGWETQVEMVPRQGTTVVEQLKAVATTAERLTQARWGGKHEPRRCADHPDDPVILTITRHSTCSTCGSVLEQSTSSRAQVPLKTPWTCQDDTPGAMGDSEEKPDTENRVASSSNSFPITPVCHLDTPRAKTGASVVADAEMICWACGRAETEHGALGMLACFDAYVAERDTGVG